MSTHKSDTSAAPQFAAHPVSTKSDTSAAPQFEAQPPQWSRGAIANTAAGMCATMRGATPLPWLVFARCAHHEAPSRCVRVCEHLTKPRCRRHRTTLSTAEQMRLESPNDPPRNRLAALPHVVHLVRTFIASVAEQRGAVAPFAHKRASRKKHADMEHADTQRRCRVSQYVSQCVSTRVSRHHRQLGLHVHNERKSGVGELQCGRGMGVCQSG